MVLLGARSALAQCTLTNIGKNPFPELGYKLYQGYPGGLYLNYANNRPPAHLAAGLQIATNQIKPLDASGNVNTNTGKIVLISVGMSNATQEFASGDTQTSDTTKAFKYRADADPAKNPQVVIVDGAQGGQDATQWTNLASATWSTLLSRLTQAGVSTQQVQVCWLKESLKDILQYGSFPTYAQLLETDLEMIVRDLKVLFPNIRLVYVSSRTRAYTVSPTATNPEPASWEVGFSTKWMIEQQINGDPALNYDPAKGPVVAPHLSWGPYLWTDGTVGRADGLLWFCSDLISDLTHPSSNGVHKVASQLLSFFKTDPTATPWFLKRVTGGAPPTCSASADVTNGVAPLTVHFSVIYSGSVTQAVWTYDDGEAAFGQTNPVKGFPTPGVYTARVTVSDVNGNSAQSTVRITANATFNFWRNDKFTASELTNSAISGASANPDLDGFPNLLEYAMGLEPKTSNSTDTVSISLSNGIFLVSFPHLKAATDVSLVAQSSTDLSNWTAESPQSRTDDGPIETIVIQSPLSTNTARFFRLKATLIP